MTNLKQHIENDAVVLATKQTATQLNRKVFLIGGYVRDILLERPSVDIDFVIDGGDAGEFASKVASLLTPRPAVTVFKTFRTAHFSYNGIEYEFVGARKESYSPGSRNPQVEEASLDEDMQRRDFSINALSISINEEDFGTLHDPFQGLEDLKNRILRTPVSPIRTFNDDPLRMLRAIRFSATLGFSIDSEALDAMVILNKRIQIVAPERIAEELNKMLMAPKPSEALSVLCSSGLMTQILPEIEALSGVDRVGKYAHKDIMLHTFEVLDNVANMSNNLWLRWAALLHDVGKPPVKKFQKEHGWTFHGHEVVGSRITEKIFSRLKLPKNEKLDYVKKLVGLHLRPIALVENEVSDSAVRRLLFECGDDIEDLMTLCRADITSKNEDKVKRYLENFDMVTQKLIEVEAKDRVRNWQPPISGETIMETFGLEPSREVGIIKMAIREAILDGIIPNNFDDAYSFMINFASSLQLFPQKKN